ncbi:Dihydrolipoyllysine-residue acetyltransferase component of acetoin cleaving system [Planctomycetes bacterium Pla163]|uniref:Dihydrolipoyllysine-residue acetyltransferase component of acetoin cleaving system n=1 Tax=Rohdeia mirabilis TaxID=2528008 RepID=A0A518CVR5_9BACT|nr:Dihydrolipoyllysine-residue acetyltransferase component of acetoin cleaving system [Planctomycetes bacterium Pla163]
MEDQNEGRVAATTGSQFSGARPQEASGARRRKGPKLAVRLGLTVVGAAAVGATAVLAGCASMPKSEIRAQLLALEKNRAVADIGLESLTMRADLDGEGAREYELVYLHVPVDPGYSGPSRAPIVLVHGTPDTLFAWSPLIFGEDGGPGLAGPRDVYAIEVIGHGIAPGSGRGTTFERCARFVNAAVDALGIEPAHIVGNSYGGEFAWRAALNAPGDFASLTIIDSSGYERRPEEFLPEEVEMRENGLAGIGYLINSRERIRTALEPHYDVVPDGRVDEVFLVAENRDNWLAMVDLVRDEEGWRQDEIANITTPTLVVWGENDIAYDLDRFGRRFAEDLPYSKLVVFPDTGHYPHESRRREFLATIEDYYRQIEGVR